MTRIEGIVLIASVIGIAFLSLILYQANLCGHYGAKNSLKTEYGAECLVEVSSGVWMSRNRHESLKAVLVARGKK